MAQVVASPCVHGSLGYVVDVCHTVHDQCLIAPGIDNKFSAVWGDERGRVRLAVDQFAWNRERFAALCPDDACAEFVPNVESPVQNGDAVALRR